MDLLVLLKLLYIIPLHTFVVPPFMNHSLRMVLKETFHIVLIRNYNQSTVCLMKKDCTGL